MKRKIQRRDFLKLGLSLPWIHLASRLPGLRPAANSTAAKQPNILVIVFDALSAANMSLHGYPRRTMPNLERLAEHAVVFHAHHAAGNFTTPGTASLLTGVYPWSHRAFHLNGEVSQTYAPRTIFNLAGANTYRQAYSHNILTSILLYQMRADLEQFEFSRNHALADLAYSDQVFPQDYNTSTWSETAILRGPGALPTSLFLSQVYRFGKALRENMFERQLGSEFPQGVPNMNDVYYLLEQGIDWCISELASLPQPFLSYIHFMPPHSPYSPSKEFTGLFADGYKPAAKPRHPSAEKGSSQQKLNQQRQAYDEHLAYVDAQFFRLYQNLEQNGMLENTCLIFTSDHGEMFERGIWGHSTRVLYEPLIHTPLLIFPPGLAQRQDIYSLTSSVDLLPTLAQLLGKPVPEWCEGLALPPFEIQPLPEARSIFAMEAKQNPVHGPLNDGAFALLKGEYKLLHDTRNPEGKDELYNLVNDPEELDNRVKVEKGIAQELRQELNQKLNEVNL